MAKKKSVSIGGQAVLEGVMMRGESSIATAVRDPEGKIQIESQRITPVKEKSKWYKVPIIRGVVSFVSSMVIGMKVLTRTSEIFGLDEEEPSKFEKWLSKKFKVELTDLAIVIGVVLGIALAIGLFVVLPQTLTEGGLKIFGWTDLSSVVKNLIVGVLRMAIFIAYIFLVSHIKDIKRLFGYHGAEHKVIACYENEMELNIENAKKNSRIHDRCGTTFLFLVMFISIIFFSFFGWPNFWVRIASRVLLIPLVAGVSYEILKWTAKYDNVFVNIVKAPGKWLQKLTTNEPDDQMIEVAICAFNEVLALDTDKTRPLQKFVTLSMREKIVTDLKKIHPNDNEIELILMYVLGCKTKSGLKKYLRIGSDKVEQAKEIAKRRAQGEPLQYILGEACFFGYDIKVNPNVLIPRMDTEILVQTALDYAKDAVKERSEFRILDLCTGSGAVALATKKELERHIQENNLLCEIVVDASDISKEAIELAKQNAQNNNTSINFSCGDLFEPLNQIYDLIIINPPYIPTKEIEGLEGEVKDFEPQIALDGGETGLDYYQRIANEITTYMHQDAYVFLEIGYNQSGAVKELFNNKFKVDVICDLAGIERVIKATKNKGDINV